jgi:hypothetical protein
MASRAKARAARVKASSTTDARSACECARFVAGPERKCCNPLRLTTRHVLSKAPKVRLDMDDPGAMERNLSPEARRALAEAEARRKAAQPAHAPPERGGPAGPEPTRYGDWERKGIASDF